MFYRSTHVNILLHHRYACSYRNANKQYTHQTVSSLRNIVRKLTTEGSKEESEEEESEEEESESEEESEDEDEDD